MHQIKDFRLAEAFCDRVYDAAAMQKGQENGAWGGLAPQRNYDMYLDLIQVSKLLQPPKHMDHNETARCNAPSTIARVALKVAVVQSAGVP